MHHTALPAMHQQHRTGLRQTQAGVSRSYLIPASSMGIIQDRVACQAQVSESCQPVEAVHVSPAPQLVVAQQDCVQVWESITACVRAQLNLSED